MLLHRRMIRSSLKTWCIEALARVDLQPARHHELLIDRLEAIERGDITRLMVLMPPGSAKSTYVSTLFPPWYLARHPQDSIVAASHTSELSERFGRRVRNIINEHAATLGISLAPDIQAANQWETTEGGEYFAVGVLGAVTGRRADCLPGDTEVLTKSGFCAIKDVEVGTSTGYVLSYDRTCGKSGFRRVVAVARRKTSQLIKIRTASGRVVEATGNHRIWTARGWTQSSSIGVGDVLMRAVWCAQDADGRRGEEVVGKPVVLRTGLQCHQAEIRSARPMRTLVCSTCRKPFERVGYEARKKVGKNVYCSSACLTVAKIKNVCRNCGR